MPTTPEARYFDVLKRPRVPLTFGTSLIGRSAYALVFLPLLYTVTNATGSIAHAGAAIALYGAGASFLAPARAWCIDRYGARPVLAALIVSFVAMISMIALAALIAPDKRLFLVLSLAAGAVAPPLGPTMRVAWPLLAPEKNGLRQRALSLDAVVEEGLYLLCPAVAGFGLAVMQPPLVLIGSAAIMLVGGVLFTATPIIGEMSGRLRPELRRADSRPRPRRPVVLERRFFVILIPVLVAGNLSGAVSVYVPDVLSNSGGSIAAGVALGCFAGGSAIGGLFYGRMRVSRPPVQQLTVLALLMVGALAALLCLRSGATVTATLAVAGLFFSPIMIVGYLAADTIGGPHRQNSATTWVNTAHNVGAATGSALIGICLYTGAVFSHLFRSCWPACFSSA